MKNPSSGDPSPFSSSTHDPKLKGQPAQQPTANQPALPSNAPQAAASGPNAAPSNVPASVQKIMAANARGTLGGGPTVITTSYKASGRVGPNAFLPMLLATLVGALATGAVYYLMAPHFSTLLVTQLFLGALLSVALWLGVRVGRVRSARYSSAFAVLGTLLVFGVFHSANVWREREQILDFYVPLLAKAKGTSVAATRAQLGRKFPYARATQAYWKDRYTSGVTLREEKSSRSSSSSGASTGAVSGGTHIAGLGYVGFLLAEIGFTALIAAGLTSIATTARFSETQGRWYSKKRAFSIGNKEVWPVLSALRAGEWATAHRTATQRKWKVADVAQVYVSHVRGESGGWVTMTITQDKQQKLLFEAEVNADALRDLGIRA